MKTNLRFLLSAVTLAVSMAASAEVVVQDAWVRATVPQQKATGAFMRLSASSDTKLVAASSPLTPAVEVHEMVMQDNIMRMRQVPAIELPAGQTVDLTSGGYHVMLMDLKQQVKAGDTVPLTLVFEDRNGQRETQQVQARVRPLNSQAQPATHSDHKH